MKKGILFLIFLAVLTNVHSQTKQDDIRHLLEITGSAQLGIQVMNSMIPQFKEIFPDVPNSFWEDFMNEVESDDLINLIIPIYDAHLTQSEIKDIIAFYETDSGKKLIKKLPLITQESMDIGQAWGTMIGIKIQEKLVEDGLIIM